MSPESLLENTQSQVESIQRVLSEVQYGLEVAEKVETIAKRTRPVLRWVIVTTLGCVVVAGVLLVIDRRRKSGDPPPPMPSPRAEDPES